MIIAFWTRDCILDRSSNCRSRNSSIIFRSRHGKGFIRSNFRSNLLISVTYVPMRKATSWFRRGNDSATTSLKGKSNLDTKLVSGIAAIRRRRKDIPTIISEEGKFKERTLSRTGRFSLAMERRKGVWRKRRKSWRRRGRRRMI